MSAVDSPFTNSIDKLLTNAIDNLFTDAIDSLFINAIRNLPPPRHPLSLLKRHHFSSPKPGNRLFSPARDHRHFGV